MTVTSSLSLRPPVTALRLSKGQLASRPARGRLAISKRSVPSMTVFGANCRLFQIACLMASWSFATNASFASLYWSVRAMNTRSCGKREAHDCAASWPGPSLSKNRMISSNSNTHFSCFSSDFLAPLAPLGTLTTGQLGRACQTLMASSSPSVMTRVLPPPNNCWPNS